MFAREQPLIEKKFAWIIATYRELFTWMITTYSEIFARVQPLIERYPQGQWPQKNICTGINHLQINIHTGNEPLIEKIFARVKNHLWRSLGEHGIWYVSRGPKSTIFNIKTNIVGMPISIMDIISENLNAKPLFVWKLLSKYALIWTCSWAFFNFLINLSRKTICLRLKICAKAGGKQWG